ncbi:PACE efflux transporter [Pseudomonas corrugata]
MLFVAPALALTYDQGLVYSTQLSLLISAVALAWNMLFNGLFEWWERRQYHRHRSWRRRLLHSLGFEGGLTLILTPVIGEWLGISLWLALITNLGLFALFFFYSLVFQWGFDRVFDVPLSSPIRTLRPVPIRPEPDGSLGLSALSDTASFTA